MAWRCEFLTARPSQDGRVVAEKRLSEELSVHPTHWLISTQLEFLTEQPSVMKVTWDSVDYLNENAEQTPEPEGGPAPGKPKAPPVRRKKRRRKKKSTSKKGDL